MDRKVRSRFLEVISRISVPSASAVALTVAISCAIIAGVSQSTAVSDFYCENSDTNFATGYQHVGTYADGQDRSIGDPIAKQG